MCGIVGFVATKDNANDILHKMLNSISHRGPDEQGVFNNNKAYLGHARLSVIDLDAGRQPLCNEDESIWVVFNGEIYNFKALRDELKFKGHIFKTNTDTEVLVHGYEEWGDELLNKLRGMFAFCILDINNNQMLIARDMFGIKPLYYYQNANEFAFASELKAIAQYSGDATSEIDLESVGLFLERQFIPAPRTIYAKVKKLKQAHAIRLDLKNDTLTLSQFQYTKIDYSEKYTLNEQESCNVVQDALEDSVRAMMVSDVSLGVFLSGGIDSSLVAAIAAKYAPKIDTFTIGFDGKDSEHKYAETVSKHIGASGHTLILSPHDVLSKFDYWGDIFDEPFADQAALPTLLLTEYAKKDITVALTGEGADEIFGGYFNYPTRLKEEKIVSILAHKLSILPNIARMLPSIAKKDRIISAILEPKSRRYVAIPNVFDKALFCKYFTPQFLQSRNETMADYAETFYNECNSQNYLDKILHIDLNLWLPDDLLTKVDRATMAYGLEARVPYLDQKFIEITSKIEPNFKCNQNVGKYLLKKIALNYLPQEIVYRHKQGFVMPLSEWLEDRLKPLVMDAMQTFAMRGIFKKQALEQLLKEHYSGKKNHSGRIWTILILERWFRNFRSDFKI